MSVFWGLLALGIGIVFLGAEVGTWSREIVLQIMRFWPLVLVLFGIALIVRRSKAAFWLMLTAFILAAALIYNSVTASQPLLNSKREDIKPQTQETKFSQDFSGNIQRAILEINTGAINFEVSGETEKLYEGALLSNFSDLKADNNISEDVSTTKLSTVTFRKGVMFRNIKNELDLRLQNKVPQEIKVETGASDMNLDLSKIILSRLVMKTGASKIRLNLGEKTANDAKIDFEAGASDIKIEFPKTLGVKINSESGLVNNDFQGFTKRDNSYYSEGYDQAQKKIEINFKTGVSSIEVKSR